MFYKTDLILLVGLMEYGEFSPKKVTIWNTTKNVSLCSSLPFLSPIKIAKINKVRMIIVDYSFLYIYSTGDMKILYTINVKDITLGKLVLSPNSDKNVWLCFSSSTDGGEIQVYDTLYPSTVKTRFQAHKSPIMKICLNKEGDRLATCSCKGTIIRIFSIPKGDKLCTFKRGISNAFIFYMNFSANSEDLICTSDAGMIYIFDIKEELDNIEKNNEARGFTKVLARGLFSLVSSIIPKEYEDSFGTQGANIMYKNDKLKLSNIIGFNNNNNNEAFCFTSDGTFSLYNIDYNKKVIEPINETKIE